MSEQKYDAVQHFDSKALGLRVKKLRQEKHLSQEQLAEKLNVSQNMIAKIECGLRTPSIDLLLNLMETLETSVEYLLRGDQIEEIEKQIEEIDNVLVHWDELKELLLTEREKLLRKKKELQ